MRHQMLVVLTGLALLGFGWSVGRAQNLAPDFELLVTAAGASSSVRCVRGCTVTTAGRPKPDGSPVVTLTCEGSVVKCGEVRVSGWIER